MLPDRKSSLLFFSPSFFFSPSISLHSHKGSDGDSGIGPIPIPDAIPRLKTSRDKGEEIKRKYFSSLFPLAVVCRTEEEI